MGSIITRARKITITRLSTQISALALVNFQLINRWVATRGCCAPLFYCHACPLAIFACPLGVMVNFARLQLIPWITLGILGLAGSLGGRLVCGWICPFGLLQDLLYKLRTRKFLIPPKLAYVKYVLLVVFVLLVPYFNPTPSHALYHATFCDGCPSGIMESMIPRGIAAHWNLDWGVFNGFTARFIIRSGILLSVLIFVTLVSRGFCRVFCPLGAIFALFNRFSLFRFSLAHKQCTGCSACGRVCPVAIDPVTEMNTTECIRCYDCTSTRHIKMGIK